MMAPFGETLSEDELEKIFGDAQVDALGRIDFEQFAKVMVS